MLLISVFHLRWIHASLSLSRSEEEIVIVEAEMNMTHASYCSNAMVWRSQALKMANSPGSQAFAWRQTAIWEAQAQRALQSFNEIMEKNNIVYEKETVNHEN